MSYQRILGIIAIIAGVVMIGFSIYIRNEVSAGSKKIAAGERSVGMMDKLFSASPATQQVGSQLTKSGKSKLAKGKEDVAYYTSLANKLQVGGIALIIAGAGIFFIGKKKKGR